MPPTSVPHTEPRPPITAASKAKSSCAGAGVGIEGGAHAEERAGQRDGRDGDRRRDGVDAARSRCRRARRCRGPRRWRGSRGPSGVRSRNSCRPPSTTTATSEDERRQIADVDARRRSTELVVCEVADVAPSDRRVGAELLEQQVLDHDRQAEGGQQRHQHARAQAALEHDALQQPADRAPSPAARSTSATNGEMPMCSTSTTDAGRRRAPRGRRARG